MKISFNTTTDYFEVREAHKAVLVSAGLLAPSQYMLYGKDFQAFDDEARRYIEETVRFKKTGQKTIFGTDVYQSDCGRFTYHNNGHSRMYQSRKDYCQFVGSDEEIIELWKALM